MRDLYRIYRGGSLENVCWVKEFPFPNTDIELKLNKFKRPV